VFICINTSCLNDERRNVGNWDWGDWVGIGNTGIGLLDEGRKNTTGPNRCKYLMIRFYAIFARARFI
jgi:hypothetical protein